MSNSIQKEIKSRLHASAQLFTSSIQQLGVRRRTTEECRGWDFQQLDDRWLEVATINLLKFLFLHVNVLWYELLLMSQLSRRCLLCRYMFSYSLAAAETMVGSELGWEDPSSSGTWRTLRQQTWQFAELLCVFLGSNEELSLSIANVHEKKYHEGRYDHSLGGWMWSGIYIQLSEGNTNYK